MALKAEQLLSRVFPIIETSITPEACMLYALGIGLGRDPMREDELRYVYEKNLLMFPTMPAVIGYPGSWMTDPTTGITYSLMLHGAESMRFIKRIPIGSAIRATNRVTAIYDRGAAKGAIMVVRREIVDAATGEMLATVETQVFCRADGGCGSSTSVKDELYRALPSGAPDRSVGWTTDPNVALIYRLSGDFNPLHVDKEIAASSGFERPILQGLCTYGCVAAAIMRAAPNRTLIGFDARFSNPVFPGETISVDIWDGDGEIRFRAYIAARDIVVLDRGSALFA